MIAVSFGRAGAGRASVRSARVARPGGSRAARAGRPAPAGASAAGPAAARYRAAAARTAASGRRVAEQRRAAPGPDRPGGRPSGLVVAHLPHQFRRRCSVRRPQRRRPTSAAAPGSAPAGRIPVRTAAAHPRTDPAPRRRTPGRRRSGRGCRGCSRRPGPAPGSRCRPRPAGPGRGELLVRGGQREVLHRTDGLGEVGVVVAGEVEEAQQVPVADVEEEVAGPGVVAVLHQLDQREPEQVLVEPDRLLDVAADQREVVHPAHRGGRAGTRARCRYFSLRAARRARTASSCAPAGCGMRPFCAPRADPGPPRPVRPRSERDSAAVRARAAGWESRPGRSPSAPSADQPAEQIGRRPTHRQPIAVRAERPAAVSRSVGPSSTAGQPSFADIVPVASSSRVSTTSAGRSASLDPGVQVDRVQPHLTHPHPGHLGRRDRPTHGAAHRRLPGALVQRGEGRVQGLGGLDQLPAQGVHRRLRRVLDVLRPLVTAGVHRVSAPRCGPRWPAGSAPRRCEPGVRGRAPWSSRAAGSARPARRRAVRSTARTSSSVPAPIHGSVTDTS